MTNGKIIFLFSFFLGTTFFLSSDVFAKSLKQDDTASEIESIRSQRGQTPQASEASPTKSIGPFKYPVRPTGIQKLLPDISLIGTFAGAYFSNEPTGDTGVDPSRTGFNLQEIELALQSVIRSVFSCRCDVGIQRTWSRTGRRNFYDAVSAKRISDPRR